MFCHEQQCWGKMRPFVSDSARWHYLTHFAGVFGRGDSLGVRQFDDSRQTAARAESLQGKTPWKKCVSCACVPFSRVEGGQTSGPTTRGMVQQPRLPLPEANDKADFFILFPYKWKQAVCFPFCLYFSFVLCS